MTTTISDTVNTTHAEVFSFGDPEPVLDTKDIFWEGVWIAANEWWEPPVPFSVLSRSYRATAHHGSALQVKRNLLLKTFVPHPHLTRQAFAGIALDFLMFGNCYVEEIRSRLGGRMRFERRLAKYMRRGAALDRYYWVPVWLLRTEIAADRICHILEPDVDQDIYGLPDYLGAMQSAWLNEAATLFRRRYYINGSHAGFILYMSDAQQNQDDVDAIREALRNSKGPGNFRNLFVYSPGGKKDGIQLIPVAEVGAKDDFLNIKAATRDDQLAAHRIPPQLLGIVPQGSAGFGDVTKAAAVFFANEVEPLQQSLMALNAWAGDDIIRFHPYMIEPDPGITLDPSR